MIRLLYKLWPSLMPLLGFLLWKYWLLPALKKRRDSAAERRALLWSLAASVLILVVLVAADVLRKPSNAATRYTPPKYENGVIMPSELHE